MKNKKSVVTIIIALMASLFITACSSYEKDADYTRGYDPKVGQDTTDEGSYAYRDKNTPSERTHNTYKSSTTDSITYDSTTRYESGVTAQDQGTSDWDVNTTKVIRQQIVKEEDFSTSAKNVKVITINGNVYLKGPVQTMAEKNRIEKIARDAAGMSKVNSEIVINR